jgi:hypothetical protein
MDPVRAMCTPATYRVRGTWRHTPAIAQHSSRLFTASPVSASTWRLLPASVTQGYPFPFALLAKYSDAMTSATSFPGPRDGLDEGDLAELAQDSREIQVDVKRPRPWATSDRGPINVPDDASTLIDGLAAYGA